MTEMGCNVSKGHGEKGEWRTDRPYMNEVRTVVKHQGYLQLVLTTIHYTSGHQRETVKTTITAITSNDFTIT